MRLLNDRPCSRFLIPDLFGGARVTVNSTLCAGEMTRPPHACKVRSYLIGPYTLITIIRRMLIWNLNIFALEISKF